MNNPNSFTIIMPVFNGALSLPGTFTALEQQQHKALIALIIIVNDGSSDDSHSVIEDYIQRSSFTIKYVRHQRSLGLAATYNEAIGQVTTPGIITMHQDIRPIGQDAFERIAAKLSRDQVAAAFPIVMHSQQLWLRYNFWQQCLFSRHVQRAAAGLTGKFDGFRTAALESVGLFDSKHYRTAGEDAELRCRLLQAGWECVESGMRVEHAEEANPRFGLQSWFRKEAQYAEARGTVLRRNGPAGLKAFAATFFREILVVGLLVPYVRYLAVVLILAYALSYTGLVIRHHLSDPRSLALPFLNIALLPINCFYSLRAFVRGREVV